MNNYTEQELEISNKSYTNKDFNTIYPELLDLVKKLTNKWDPTTSNESDPGVVLLKLWAILADKNNYNIDKNILETFPLSVTQRANAQKLYDMLGYDMHYYKSAVTDITMWYIGNVLTVMGDPDSEKVTELTVPKFTMITDDSGEIIFTLLDETTFSAKASPVVVKAIQGTIHDYEVNGVTDITLDNLDSEYRLFFTESRIAENGIFIANKGLSGVLDFEEWTKVTNLESATLNSKVYKFGVLPNTQSCYIQFPQDIGTLIGNGLKIKYIISDGVSGNVQANQLTTFKDQIIPLQLTNSALESDSNYSEYYEASINSDVTIKNTYSTTNGADPEDIDSAYKNYKKTIGTFNTLVTLEDYQKAIYNLVDDLGLPFCSNAVVSDRTNNIVYSTDVVTLNGASVEHQLYVDSVLEKITPLAADGSELELEDENKNTIPIYTKKPKMSAFDLGLHILNPMVDIEDKTGYYYNKSFSVSTLYNDIVEQISNIETNNQYYKSVEHDFIDTIGNNRITYTALGENIDNNTAQTGAIPYLFKNFYTLNGKVITYYKVTEDEAREIEDNIRLALFRDYNARKVSFGQKIKYEDLVKTIEQADTRIKTLILNEPEYTLKYMSGNDYVGSAASAIPLPIDSDTEEIQQTNRSFTQRLLYELLLKMIVSGHVQLYNFNKDVEFDFGQTAIKQYKDRSYITTELNIDVNESSPIISSDGYQVTKNQNIILYAPNFYTKTSYVAYVNYQLADGKSYKSNVYYKLGLNDSIQLQYTDENGVSKSPKIPGGTCIRFVDSSNANAVLDMNNVKIDKEIDGEMKQLCTLSATQSIEVMEVNQVTFPSENNPDQKVLYCMWFTNKSQTISDDGETKIVEYELFAQGESEKLLQDNEYFIYTNADKNELVIVGSGTLLVRPVDKDNEGNINYGPAIRYRNSVPVDAIVADGQTAVTDADWYKYSLVQTAEGYKRGLGIVELQLITLGAGAGVRFEGVPDATPFKQKLQTITNDIARIEDEIEQLEAQLAENYDDEIANQLAKKNVTLSDLIASKSKLNIELGRIKDIEFQISNKPTAIINPEYCEEYSTTDLSTNVWVKLDDYQLGSDNNPDGINYYRGWSIMSRLNTMVGSAKSQAIEGNAKILLYKADEETGNISERGVVELKDVNILSNTILAFGGGDQLQITSSSGDSINIYSYVYENLPKYISYVPEGNSSIEKYFERGTDGFITISWKDWIRYANKSDSDPKYRYDTDDEIREDRLFPLSFVDTDTDTVTTGKVAVTLTGDITEAELCVKIQIPGGTGFTDAVKLDSSNPIAYIDLPNNCMGLYITSFKLSEGKTIESSSAAIEILTDTLRIGYPQLQTISEDNPEFSEQVTKTLDNLGTPYNEDNFAKDILVKDIQSRFKDFDITYEISPEDAIDGEATTSNNYNNLFAGDIIWDRNHICNRYTIPQYDFKNSSVRVAPVYIKK